MGADGHLEVKYEVAQLGKPTREEEEEEERRMIRMLKSRPVAVTYTKPESGSVRSMGDDYGSSGGGGLRSGEGNMGYGYNSGYSPRHYHDNWSPAQVECPREEQISLWVDEQSTGGSEVVGQEKHRKAEITPSGCSSGDTTSRRSARLAAKAEAKAAQGH